MLNKMELNNKACAIRKRLGADDFSSVDIFSSVQVLDKLTLVFYPLGSGISGACLKNEFSSIIVLNSSMSLGRQRFTLAHELYHFFFENKDTSTICSSKIGCGNETEREADQFASYLLMPAAALYEKIIDYTKDGLSKLSFEQIVKLEQYFGVSHQAMLVRLQEENYATALELSDFQGGVVSRAASLGFDTSLYKPSPSNKTKLVLGHYITQAEKLLELEIISMGKHEELLLDAFREDMVYGDETEGGEPID